MTTFLSKKKRCKKCHRLLPVAQFYRRSESKNGLRSQCKDCMRDYFWLYRHGITKEMSDYIIQQQNGRCAICGKESQERHHSIDHDHKTGKIRGLLCDNCNVGIGYFQDSVKLLLKAIKYLNHPPQEHSNFYVTKKRNQ